MSEELANAAIPAVRATLSKESSVKWGTAACVDGAALPEKSAELEKLCSTVCRAVLCKVSGVLLCTCTGLPLPKGYRTSKIQCVHARLPHPEEGWSY